MKIKRFHQMINDNKLPIPVMDDYLKRFEKIKKINED